MAIRLASTVNAVSAAVAAILGAVNVIATFSRSGTSTGSAAGRRPSGATSA